MWRVLGDPAAVHLRLALTLAGLAATVVAGNAAWAVTGWALGGVAAVIVAAIIVAAAKTWRPPRAPGPAPAGLYRTPAEALADHQRRAAVATFSVTPTRADRLAGR